MGGPHGPTLSPLAHGARVDVAPFLEGRDQLRRCELHAGGGVDEVEVFGERAGEALGCLREESQRRWKMSEGFRA